MNPDLNPPVPSDPPDNPIGPIEPGLPTAQKIWVFFETFWSMFSSQWLFRAIVHRYFSRWLTRDTPLTKFSLLLGAMVGIYNSFKLKEIWNCYGLKGIDIPNSEQSENLRSRLFWSAAVGTFSSAFTSFVYENTTVGVEYSNVYGYLLYLMLSSIVPAIYDVTKGVARTYEEYTRGVPIIYIGQTQRVINPPPASTANKKTKFQTRK